MVVLFSIFANISVIEDRREASLLVPVAADAAHGLVLGKILGATTIGSVQGWFSADSAARIPVAVSGLPAAGAAVALMAFGLSRASGSSLGGSIRSRASTQ
ncbi:MAG: hypothetical protein R2748_03175 [Bryobacterales bacterium]